MGRPKGGKNRTWSPEEKLRIVERYYSSDISRRQLCIEEKISDGQLHSWIKKYETEGAEGLVAKTGLRGNSFSALHKAKDLPELKQMQLRIAKLEVDVERLKKGYIVKGVGATKEFAITKDLNLTWWRMPGTSP